MSGEIARLSARRRGAPTVVARIPATRGEGALEGLLASLAPRAMEVRRLETVASEVPATIGEAVRRVVRMAAIVAAAFGSIGALVGAMLVEQNALSPSMGGMRVGWISGPLVGAALGAGLAGALGFLVGAVAMLLLPSLAVERSTAHATFLIVRCRPFDLEAVVTTVIEAGGSIAAIGEG